MNKPKNLKKSWRCKDKWYIICGITKIPFYVWMSFPWGFLQWTICLILFFNDIFNKFFIAWSQIFIMLQSPFPYMPRFSNAWSNNKFSCSDLSFLLHNNHTASGKQKQRKTSLWIEWGWEGWRRGGFLTWNSYLGKWNSAQPLHKFYTLKGDIYDGALCKLTLILT